MEIEKAIDINDVLKNLNEKVEAVYRHGALQQDYSLQIHDYGNGYFMSEIEAHTLRYVCSHEETTVTRLARETFRTKGTISKMLKKLEDKGLIVRTYKAGNKKWVYFIPTDKGRTVDEYHCSYDRRKTQEMIEALLKDCTLEEIESFYKVTALRIKYLEQLKRK